MKFCDLSKDGCIKAQNIHEGTQVLLPCRLSRTEEAPEVISN